MAEEICVICSNSDSVLNLSVLREKGVNSLNSAISKRNDIKTFAIPGQYVHNNCRKNYSFIRNL